MPHSADQNFSVGSPDIKILITVIGDMSGTLPMDGF
jgi:hypothetical protein